jgi:low affinity Fe/Cu permease
MEYTRRAMGETAYATMTHFEKFSTLTTRFLGSGWTFLGAVLIVVGSGTWYGWSQEWREVVDALITLTTFLMVFVLQQSQNRDSLAMQLKLDELVAAVKGASTKLTRVEDLSEKELEEMKEGYRGLPCSTESHTIEEVDKSQE